MQTLADKALHQRLLTELGEEGCVAIRSDKISALAENIRGIRAMLLGMALGFSFSLLFNWIVGLVPAMMMWAGYGYFTRTSVKSIEAHAIHVNASARLVLVWDTDGFLFCDIPQDARNTRDENLNNYTAHNFSQLGIRIYNTMADPALRRYLLERGITAEDFSAAIDAAKPLHTMTDVETWLVNENSAIAEREERAQAMAEATPVLTSVYNQAYRDGRKALG